MPFSAAVRNEVYVVEVTLNNLHIGILRLEALWDVAEENSDAVFWVLLDDSVEDRAADVSGSSCSVLPWD